MRKAVIDLGTNTFNLLIADVKEGKLEIVHSEKEGVAIGMGGINKRIISEDAWGRAMDCLSRMQEVCKQHQVSVIHAIATSAIRDASNGLDFIRFVQANLSMAITIVSGMGEAELIHRGVTCSYDFEEPGVIMDIGGGSTEFIWANKNEVTHSCSLNIGVSRIYQEIDFSDPFTIEDVEKAIRWFEAKSNGGLDNLQADLLIGASGSFETFYELVHQKKYPYKIKGTMLPIDEIQSITKWLIHSSMEERNQNELIIPIRKKMAPLAAINTQWVIEKLGVKKVYYSPCALKEGAMISF